MTAMESKVCGKEVGVVQGWMTSFPTSSVVGSSAAPSWEAIVVPVMAVGGGGRIWFTRSSKLVCFR